MKIRLTILLFFSICYSTELAVLKVANVPAKCLFITQPDGVKDQLFILNQTGKIHIIKNGKTLDAPFLDISDRVHGSLVPGSEEGLLGLAFHPNYLTNGYFADQHNLLISVLRFQ